MRLLFILAIVAAILGGFASAAKEGKIGTGEMTKGQLNWLESRFKDSQSRHKTPYSFEQWKEWRETDGFVCNVDEDCRWIPSMEYAEDMECRKGENSVANMTGNCACTGDQEYAPAITSCRKSRRWSPADGSPASIVFWIGIVILLWIFVWCILRNLKSYEIGFCCGLMCCDCADIGDCGDCNLDLC